MKSAYSSPAASNRRLCFAALLVVVVLFAQWMGMRHRIEHADWAGNHHLIAHVADQGIAEPDLEYAGDKSHSCTLYDGMALADSAPLLPFAPVLQTSVQVLALWAAYISWDAPLLCHFSSRAPPRV
ncbi:hypothetical protein [Herminiimonas arsenitoxidans]|uniref:hypothetical protein n=1 Tax=Herminiimonas arsenitoxidans TaxID=1809410 RepID=UPI0009704FAD|nr:hypothetical protein [Herminiimonas arsenitoxidans]